MAAPSLLNDDGNASMATMLMMAHHGFRRDLARFAAALRTIERGDASRVAAVREEWTTYHESLHGHHTIEDTQIFPPLHETLGSTIDRLQADHRQIDPILRRGDRAFAALPRTADASAVVTELDALLDPHFALEEAELAPTMRDFRELPSPTSDAELQAFADGFAWSMHGISPDVVERVTAMLPESVAMRLPAARARYEARCLRVWGTTAAGAATTPIPVPA